MKFALRGLLAILATVASVEAAAIRVFNYQDDGSAASPVTNASGVVITTGSGSIAVGGFTSLNDAALAGAAASPAAWAAVLADFIAYADTKANPMKMGDGVGISGLYDGDKGQPIAAASPLVGKTIYTLIGNGATLETSTQIAIIKDNQSFAADAPVFQATANPSEAGSSIILGTTGAAIAIPELQASFASLQLVPVVPEPSSIALLAFGLAPFVRRRR